MKSHTDSAVQRRQFQRHGEKAKHGGVGQLVTKHSNRFCSDSVSMDVWVSSSILSMCLGSWQEFPKYFLLFLCFKITKKWHSMYKVQVKPPVVQRLWTHATLVSYGFHFRDPHLCTGDSSDGEIDLNKMSKMSPVAPKWSQTIQERCHLALVTSSGARVCNVVMGRWSPSIKFPPIHLPAQSGQKGL